MAKLRDDQIKWVLSLDAPGVQSELVNISSKTKELEQDTKRLEAEYKAAAKQMAEARKELERLTKAGKEDSEAFREVEATLESVSSEMTDYKRRIVENSRAIEQNKKLADEMVRTLRVEDMTMGQLKKRAKELENQLEHTSEATHPEQYAELDKQLNAVKGRMGELKNGSQSMLSVFKGGVMVMVGNLLTQGVDKIREWVSEAKEFVKESINMSKGAQGVVNAFSKLSESDRIMKEMKKSTSGTIGELELMKKTMRANEMGIPIEKMGDLMDYARRQAVKLGKDVNYMSDSLVDGIGRKSTLVLDNLGLSATRVQAEVKKTGDFTQAIMKIVNEELAKQGAVELTGADIAAQAAAKREDAMLAVGKRMQWLGEAWDKLTGNFYDGIKKMTGETRTASEVFDDQLEKVAQLTVNTSPLIDKYEELSKKVKLNYDQTKDLNPEQEQLLSIINQIREAIPGVVTEFDKYGRAIGINTDKAREFIQTQIAMLKYMNQDAIQEAQKSAEEYSSILTGLYNRKNKGGYQTTIGGGIGGWGGTNTFHTLTPEEQGVLENEIAKYEQLRTGANERIKVLDGTSLEEQQKNSEQRLKQQSSFNEMNKKQLDEWIKDTKNANSEYLAIAQQSYRQRFGGNPDVTPKTPKTDPELQKQRKQLNLLNEKLETTHQEKLAKIRQDYLDGKIVSESDYKRKEFAQEQAYNILRESFLKEFLDKTTKEELKSDISNQISTIHDKRLAQEIEFRKNLEKILLDADPEKKEKDVYADRLVAIGLFGIDKEKMTREQLAAVESLEKQHEENLLKIRNAGKAKNKALSEEEFEKDFKSTKEAKKAEIATDEQNLELNIGMGALTGDAAFAAELELHNKRIALIQAEIDARDKAGLETDRQYKELYRKELDLTKVYTKEFDRRKQEYTKYGNDVGTVLGNVITGQENALQGFSDVLIDILFDTLTQIITAEIAKVTVAAIGSIAITTANEVASKGFIGIGTAAVLTGIITAAMTVAKTSLKSMLGKKSGGAEKSGSSGQRVVNPGFADGGYHEGYTGPGAKYDVKGFFPDGQPYHAGEYIIPKEKLRLPTVARMVRQIDSIGSQSQSNKNPLPDGFADGGYHANNTTSSEYNNVMAPVLSDLTRAIELLKENGVAVNYYEFERAKSTIDGIRNRASKR